MRSRRFAFLAILLCTSAAARAFAAASLTPLGDLPGGSFWSQAHGVSGDGSVVVGRSSSASSDFSGEAFRWTSDGGMVGLGIPPGSLLSQAFGVSGDGSVIVGYSGEAFRWTSDGGMMGLGILPGAISSSASGVSGDGSVVVGYGYRFDLSGREAFRWTSDGGMVALGHLPGGAFDSEANGVSADGSVIVGWSRVSDDSLNSEPFRWTSDGGMVGLGHLPGGEFDSSNAIGVSGDGSVIVGSSSSTSGFYSEAFRWTSDGGMVGLGKLPGAYSSEASGVSGDGSIVVGITSWYPSSGPGAFYWTADGGMRTLWDVLLSHGVDPAVDGWTNLGYPSDISADGSTIVGFGDRNGNLEAFVAVIPIAPELPGDFDGDGDVDGRDFLAWQRGDSPSPLSSFDLANWQTHFGTGPDLLAATTSVPEPAVGALALLGVCRILLLRRRSPWRPNTFSLSKDEPCD